MDGVLIPPLNFSMAAPGIYRSGYPNSMNHAFMKKLQLKTILYLCPEDYSEANTAWCRAHNVQIVQCGILPNKEPFQFIPEDVVADALRVLLDCRNHPILMHCNSGKHRSGVVIGTLRKMQGWSLTSIFDEYRRFAGSKVRILDQQFIELFRIESVTYDKEYAPRWLR
ncbi:hypothetical protein, conserved [Cyanidioschyzon merolae strain 10D]|jgi:tyrosine-protein phosphatase SIW14|uniref:diphosphoinositol-polyphosphate diphosphatase n=1 Tax=Cyanidioschyzon merolae (strain NIES-3377 / 10D) TaxID=280699 RepID=M1V7D6_CYAM1|nr:hypothetical protein, conserved [Cyanidioschyzon merolae strain 10D]BAM82990.1 hypothetical protein, conserved [Cyanidioschyzon merolae strain 10D]|eukprot:XP_005539026.1 hypothetical protein, conserved [Cyanidioschyzon merolae strain 10D]